MNLNSHFELAYLRTLHVGIKKVHTKREGLHTPIKFLPDSYLVSFRGFRGCGLKIASLIYLVSRNKKINMNTALSHSKFQSLQVHTLCIDRKSSHIAS